MIRVYITLPPGVNPSDVHVEGHEITEGDDVQTMVLGTNTYTLQHTTSELSSAEIDDLRDLIPEG